MSWWNLLLGVALLFSFTTFGWLWVAYSLFQRFRLTESVEEVIKVPLPRPGHFITLYHHPAAHESRGFMEPVILCHGLGATHLNVDLFDDGTGSDRSSLARSLSRAGFDTWVLELRGRGEALVPEGESFTVDDEVKEDVPAAIALVLERTGAKQVFWVAHSKGAVLQYLFQTSGHPLSQKVAAMVSIGAAASFRLQRRFLLPLVPAGRLCLQLFGFVPLKSMALAFLPLAPLLHPLAKSRVTAIGAYDLPLFLTVLANIPGDINRGVADQVLSWIESPEGRLTRTDGSNLEDDLKKITLPILFVTGSRDPLAPLAAVEDLAKRVSSTDLSWRNMGRAGGSRTEYGHGDLILGKNAPLEIFPEIASWLSDRASPKA